MSANDLLYFSKEFTRLHLKNRFWFMNTLIMINKKIIWGWLFIDKWGNKYILLIVLEK